MLANTRESWGAVSRFFHWGMAFMMFIMLAVGFALHWHWVPKASRGLVYALHMNLGFVILVLVLVRIFWRLSNVTPDLPSDLPAWQRAGYQNTAFLLYALMIIFPLSGALMSLFRERDLLVLWTWTLPAFSPASPDLARFFNRVHYVSGFSGVALVALHLAGALYHHWILKDNTLTRMWRGG